MRLSKTKVHETLVLVVGHRNQRGREPLNSEDRYAERPHTHAFSAPVTANEQQWNSCASTERRSDRPFRYEGVVNTYVQ